MKRKPETRKAAAEPTTSRAASKKFYRFFRWIAMIAVPCLFLLMVEAGLRLAGYGYSTDLFDTVRINGRDFLMNNETFSRRFFPEELARWPSPIMIPALKSPGTYRIFILGESAAQGDPQPAFGPARYLEALLNKRYPGINFEIVNVGITAINSNVILPIARECAKHEGDLWIIYMGNNEMVGPFGAATVFGTQAPPLPVIRASLALQETRVGQLFVDLSHHMHKSNRQKAWGGMSMFLGNEVRPGDPRKEMVYRNFERNLHDILRVGLDSGAKVLLNTVAVNLKDCPPFASAAGTNAAGTAAKFDELYRDGSRRIETGDYPGAEQALNGAIALNPEMANAQFQLAECLLHRTNFPSAHTHFQAACDEDALPFRTDSRLNAAIRQAGEHSGNANLSFCDAAGRLEKENSDGVCGQETFYEHVHFNFAGAYRLGLVWAQSIEPLLPPEIKSRATAVWADQQICDQRLGLSDWNRADTLHEVMQRFGRPPLSSQPNNDWRLSGLQAELKRINAQKRADSIKDITAIFEQAELEAPQDYYVRENFGEFLELIGDPKKAVAQWHQAHDLMPRNPFAYLSEGQLLAGIGDVAGARKAFMTALDLHPRYGEVWLELGKLDAYDKDYEGAIRKYLRADQIRPGDPEVFLCIGKARSLQKKSDDAIENFRHAVELNANYWEGIYALGGELGMRGEIAEARKQFQKVIQLNPEFAPAHLNLGVALLKADDFAGARDQFGETLRLEPGNKVATQYLAVSNEKLKIRQVSGNK